jgi:chaperone required for assembly of F1-ATPase
MRDIFDDVFQEPPRDPVEAARRAMRPPLPQRFYRTVGVAELGGKFAVLLDGRSVKTPAHATLASPSRRLSEAIAAEWDAQRDVIDPAKMPLTRLANAIIDGVAPSGGRVAEEIAKYLASDLVFYRAAKPDALMTRQAQAWDPLLGWAAEAFGARFVLAQGVVHVTQPEPALAAMRAAIPDDPWRLGAVNSITTLTGSALIALALLHVRLSADAAWAAAHVDEDWNMEQWGRDELALRQRAYREAEMRAAATVLALL